MFRLARKQFAAGRPDRGRTPRTTSRLQCARTRRPHGGREHQATEQAKEVGPSTCQTARRYTGLSAPTACHQAWLVGRGAPRRGAATRASAPRPTLPPSACPTVHRPRHPRRSGHAPRRRTPSLPPGRPHPVGPDSDGPDDRRPMGRRPVAGPHQGPYHLHVGRHRRRRVLTRWTGSLRPGPCPRAHRGTSAGPAGRGRLA